ncbi:hypothetical protein FB567DRAFT_54912 [Paraphoma chrysanthemicola]|uniref:Uncharacterized protein n=1 Tax=Paraphoma chrysanthemicola TaxID=798071 RepID=A0A8K0R7C2_9PLEO|nr:hypothetical protein FB567DRAFT_54912 [Paraphoma chrysanthemicola]
MSSFIARAHTQRSQFMMLLIPAPLLMNTGSCIPAWRRASPNLGIALHDACQHSQAAQPSAPLLTNSALDLLAELLELDFHIVKSKLSRKLPSTTRLMRSYDWTTGPRRAEDRFGGGSGSPAGEATPFIRSSTMQYISRQSLRWHDTRSLLSTTRRSDIKSWKAGCHVHISVTKVYLGSFQPSIFNFEMSTTDIF